MNMLVLVLFAVGCLHNTAANSIYESTGMAAAETILNDMNSVMSTTRLMNRASTQCWMESITTMSRWDAVSGSSYCASLSTEQQKILALELTNCQLLEENRPLFAHHHRDEKSMSLSSDHTSCPVGKNGSEPYEVSSCLRFMSDFALNLYHQMLLYANDMCNRLTHDVMEQQKEETTRMLMEASSSFIELTRKQQLEVDLAQKARERAMDEAITRNKLHLEEHQRQWEEVNHARQMEVARAQEVREKAAEAREREMEAREKAALLTMEEIVSQNMIHFQEQQQRWEELNLARAKEMHIVEERREQTEAIIKKQQYDMEKMQEVRDETLNMSICFINTICIDLTYLSLFSLCQDNRNHEVANTASIEHARVCKDGYERIHILEINLDIFCINEYIMDGNSYSIAEQSKALSICGVLHWICTGTFTCASW